MASSESGRLKVAAAARALLAGSVSFTDFLREVPDDTDSEIEELVELITHEPQRGGILGAPTTEWQAYRAAINSLIQRLEG